MVNMQLLNQSNTLPASQADISNVSKSFMSDEKTSQAGFATVMKSSAEKSSAKSVNNTNAESAQLLAKFGVNNEQLQSLLSQFGVDAEELDLSMLNLSDEELATLANLAEQLDLVDDNELAAALPITDSQDNSALANLLIKLTNENTSSSTGSNLASDSGLPRVDSLTSSGNYSLRDQLNQIMLNQSNDKTASASQEVLSNPILGGGKQTVKLDSKVDSLISSLMNNAENGSDRLQFKAVIAQPKGASASELGQKLTTMLADKLSIQVHAKAPVATIRLDPPDLGKIDLTVRLDNDKLHVQLQASSQATRESINATTDRLRHELMAQNFLDVEVTVTQDGSDTNTQSEHYRDDELIHTALHNDVEELATPIEHFEQELARA